MHTLSEIKIKKQRSYMYFLDFQNQIIHQSSDIKSSKCLLQSKEAMPKIYFKKEKREKVYFMSQILVNEYWSILDHFLRSSIVSFWITPARSKERKYHIFRQYWYTRIFQYSPILGRSSIWDLKYTFSEKSFLTYKEGAWDIFPLLL